MKSAPIRPPGTFPRCAGEVAKRGQLRVISHAQALVEALEDIAGVVAVELVRENGETRTRGRGLLDEPPWP